MYSIRKWILKWLFGCDVLVYYELLNKNIDITTKYLDYCELEHKRNKEELELIELSKEINNMNGILLKTCEKNNIRL